MDFVLFFVVVFVKNRQVIMVESTLNEA